jgi:hypothetical protein
MGGFGFLEFGSSRVCIPSFCNPPLDLDGIVAHTINPQDAEDVCKQFNGKPFMGASE